MSNSNRNLNAELRELESELRRKTLKRGVGSRNVIRQGIETNRIAEEKRLQNELNLLELNLLEGGAKQSKQTRPNHTNYVSVQERIINGQGQRNIVSIKNGLAEKTVEKIVNGKSVKRKTRKLTSKERRNILRGTFVPGLWKNCCV